MSKYLVIVESPAKSKTIEKYLGSDYFVASSKGHVRDLTTRGFGGFGVDIEDNFKPMYKVLKDKSAVVKELKQMVKSADKVFLATDPDREGEAISWHLYEILGLEEKDYERIVFHEITKKAVLNALENGRDLDLNLVRSQESRRILDRIIGFSLSKLLQRKIGSKSAGRVQSVALKLIVDREKEIQKFIPEEYWEMFCEFKKNKEQLKAKLISFNDEKIKLTNEEETKKVLSALGKNYIVSNIINKEREKSSKPPFITSTLQQEASSKFNFNVRKTMQIAQKLYEGIELGDERVGIITYIRTDSQRLSDQFLNDGKKYIFKEFGEKYYKGYQDIKDKSKNIQDAHEAIRPSNINYTPEYVKKYLSNDEYKLYTIIYNRAIASMMSNAVIEDEKVKIDNNGYIFEINGERVIFDGYLKIYSKYEEEDKTLPKFELSEKIVNPKIITEQKFTNPPLRYSEARLIKKMEELGIGRPSTYAVTIETLKQRYYVKVEKKVFVPTEQGILTSEKLDEFFSKVINIEYTAKMEKILDEISEGEKNWSDELKRFYNDYMPLVDYANEKMEKIYPIYLDEDCPQCGSKLVYRNGRFGRFVACSGFPNCRYIKKNEEDEPEKTDVKCPVCKEGNIVIRVGRKGRAKGKKFYACDRYPDCKTTFSELPSQGEEK
ncbi:MAG: type I DNA topoisomerase [Bacilli bacterium]